MTGSKLKEEFLAAFDETGDRIVTFEEFGKKGVFSMWLRLLGNTVHQMGVRPMGGMNGQFAFRALMLKWGETGWNAEQFDMTREYNYGFICLTALRMSQMDLEMPDPFQPGLVWGRGRWPSFELAKFMYTGMTLYGEQFPAAASVTGLYGTAFLYADLTQNQGRFTGPNPSTPDPEGLNRYTAGVSEGREKPLDFTFFVPTGFDAIGGNPMPNVEATDDPARILTVALRLESGVLAVGGRVEAKDLNS